MIFSLCEIKWWKKVSCGFWKVKMPTDVIKPQERAPDIALTAFDEERDLYECKLSNFLGQYVLLLFFPNGNPVCQSESVSFSHQIGKFVGRGCVVLGCTVASPTAILGLKHTTLEKGGVKGMRFPILCDEDGSICRQWGMVDRHGDAHRALVILDKEHYVRHVAVHHRTVARSVKECLDLIDAYKENDTLELGVPISWPCDMHKGYTMNPTVSGTNSRTMPFHGKRTEFF